MRKNLTKRIGLLLAFLLTLSLFAACKGNEPTTAPEETGATAESSEVAGSSTEEAGQDIAGKFTVGFGRREIMPDEPVRIGGYGTVRWSEGFYSRMYI
ncbi:MAG: hypothetical protein IKY02_04515, partial [Lachnospiraceae bacterium]|nr:hypothetical protein [Lachnospiraceae bacterium]